MFRAFRHRDFSVLFAGSVAIATGNFMMSVALGWLVLEMTNSPLSLGIVWATRSAPHLIWGMIAGTVADRVDRRKLLVGGYVVQMASAATMGVLVAAGLAQLWHILVFSFVLGSVSTFTITARQAFIVDIVGREDAMTAISLSGASGRAMGIFGGAASGIVIEQFGVQWPFFAVAAGYIAGIGMLLLIREVHRETNDGPRSLRGNFVDGLRMIGRNRTVLVLLVMAIICEILGFSHHAILPVFARDVLGVGASGLGMLSSMSSAGGLLAVLWLAWLGNYRHKGRLMLGVFLLFGVFLLLFAQSPSYAASLAFGGLLGAVAASFDSLQHTMLQLSVTEEQRGRAMGVWQISLGFGPVGSLAIGAVTSLIGARLALSVNGVAIIVAFVLLVALVPRLRRA